MVKVIHKIGMVARLGVVTRLIKVEDKLVEIEHRVVEMAARVVIRHIFMQFWLVLRKKLLMR